MRSLKIISFSIIVLSFFNCVEQRKISLEKLEKYQSLQETKRLVKTFSSDELMGRKPGTNGFEKASEIAIEYLKKNNITSFYSSFYDSLKVFESPSYNIVGIIGSQNRKTPHVLIGAHLDHLGTLQTSGDSIFNGANDNASGVTAVLQMAKQLSKHKFKQNIIIALFTGEEDGLIGSKHLAQKLKKEQVNLSYVINFDMIGTTLTNEPENVYATGFVKSNLPQKINETLEDQFVTHFVEEYQYGIFYRSDNYPFFKEFNIPAHTFSTFDFTNFDYYHKPQDESDLIDYKNLNAIIRKMTLATIKMLKTPTTISIKEE